MNETREDIYNEICDTLTRYEAYDEEITEDHLYWLLCKIQNSWETIITANI